MNDKSSKEGKFDKSMGKKADIPKAKRVSPASKQKEVDKRKND